MFSLTLKPLTSSVQKCLFQKSLDPSRFRTITPSPQDFIQWENKKDCCYELGETKLCNSE